MVGTNSFYFTKGVIELRLAKIVLRTSFWCFTSAVKLYPFTPCTLCYCISLGFLLFYFSLLFYFPFYCFVFIIVFTGDALTPNGLLHRGYGLRGWKGLFMNIMKMLSWIWIMDYGLWILVYELGFWTMDLWILTFELIDFKLYWVWLWVKIFVLNTFELY